MLSPEDLLRELARQTGGLGQIHNGAVKPQIMAPDLNRPPAPSGSGGAAAKGGNNSTASNDNQGGK